MDAPWQSVEWYRNREVTAWFPCRFVFISPAFETRMDKSLYEFLCDAGYGYSLLRFHTREAPPYGLEYRVVDYGRKPERVLFQGDAWGLACWLVNDVRDKFVPFGDETFVIPYELIGGYSDE